MGHVGNGHTDGWEKATQKPREIHQRATADDPRAASRVARVNYYLHRQDVLGAVETWYDHGYGTVQIQADGFLEQDEWDDLWAAATVDGVNYVGDGRFYAVSAFVESLPEVPADGQCAYPGCRRDGPRVVPAIKDGQAAMLCPTHRKEFWGVSS